MTPTQRALKDLRDFGFTAAVVERFNRFAGQHGCRQDLFGIADILAVREGFGVLFLQVTSGAHHADHLAKIRAEPRLAAVLAAGGRVELWSYRKLCMRNAAGKRMKVKRYELRREEITTAADAA